jgi:hypothetical protein
MPCTASMIIYAWGKLGQSTVPDWVRRTFRRFYVCQAAAVARQCLGREGGAGVEGTGDVALEAPPDLTAGLGLALERVTRIELAWPAWKTKPVRLWLGGFLTCKGKG